MECMHSAIRRARAPKAGPDRRAHCPGRPQRNLPPPPGQTRPNRSRLGAATEPKRCKLASDSGTHVGAPKRAPTEGAAERPGDHTANIRRGPTRSAHATHTPARTADVPGRLPAPVAARECRNGRCSAPGAPDGGPIGGSLATHRWRARLRAQRVRGGLGRAWHGLWAGAARRQRRLRWAALAAVARRARMRRFDFWHAARTSLGRSRRAVKRPPKAVMVALATARTRAVGPAPLTHRAATSVAPAHAYRHTSARQDRADGGGGDRVQALGAAADLQRPLKDLP